MKAEARGTGSPMKSCPTRRPTATVAPGAGWKVDGSIQKSCARAPAAASSNAAAHARRLIARSRGRGRLGLGAPPRPQPPDQMPQQLDDRPADEREHQHDGDDV